MTLRTILVVPLFLLLAPALAGAHEVVSEVARGDAVVVRFTTADGIALAYEDCEVQAQGESMPLLRGKTDVEGRVAFVPDPDTEYVVRVFAADGHGGRVVVRADDVAAPTFASSSGATPAGRLVLGAALILGMFFGLGRLARARS